jgi:predicted phage terminase large subunit-like protein
MSIVKLDRGKILGEAKVHSAYARGNFLKFREYMDHKLIVGWWVKEISNTLEKFYEDFEVGKQPKLALMAPPQHGKSRAAEDFIAWVAGKNPDMKTIYASFSDELGVMRNINLQRMIASPRYQQVFGNTRCGIYGWQTNTSLIEYAGHKGSFRNVTVNGAVNGMELNLGVIDDPVKGRAEASSSMIRDRTWNWFTDDFLGRFAKNSAMLMIMTRWHVDDILGRYLERNPDVKVLCYPAIAEVDTEFRAKGEALFEEFKPLEMLLERRRMLTQASWESLYQQNPIVVGGGIFPIEKLTCIPVFDRGNIVASVRYWDKAGTEHRDGSQGAYTAGALMHKMKNNTFVIEHVARGHWGALERENMIARWAAADKERLKYRYEIIVEQEPGSGGKESAEATIRNLRGYRVFADRVTGSKVVRAEPFAAQVQGGNVFLVAGDWVNDFLDEAECFPNGKYADQIDSASGAFARLTTRPLYNLDVLAS